MELKVPGVSVKAMKRPFDAALKLHVQDIRLVDCAQTFGREYELVVCASRRDTTGDEPASSPHSSSPPSSSATPFARSASRVVEATGLGWGGGASTLGFGQLESTSADDVFSTTSDDLDSLLVLMYSFYSPNSPRHPAVRDLGLDEYVESERETSIRKVNVRCTAMEAIGQLCAYMHFLCVPEPCTRVPVPCTRVPVPCTRVPVPCTRVPVPCTRVPVPCTRVPVPCTRVPVPCTCTHVPVPCTMLIQSDLVKSALVTWPLEG